MFSLSVGIHKCACSKCSKSTLTWIWSPEVIWYNQKPVDESQCVEFVVKKWRYVAGSVCSASVFQASAIWRHAYDGVPEALVSFHSLGVSDRVNVQLTRSGVPRILSKGRMVGQYTCELAHILKNQRDDRKKVTWSSLATLLTKRTTIQRKNYGGRKP